MVRYKVAKMNCGGCAKAVTRTVHGADPGARVEVDLKAGIVSVAGTAGVPAERYVQAIRVSGYGAETLSLAA